MKGADPRPVRLLARLGVGVTDSEGSGSSAFFLLLVEEVFVEPFVVFVVFLFVVSVVFFVI